MTGNLSNALDYPSKYQLCRSCDDWTFEISTITGQLTLGPIICIKK